MTIFTCAICEKEEKTELPDDDFTTLKTLFKAHEHIMCRTCYPKYMEALKEKWTEEQETVIEKAKLK